MTPVLPPLPALILAALIVGAGTASCSQSTFAGQSKANDVVINNSDQIQVCGSSGETKVTLTTPTLENGGVGNYLDYTVSLTDCSGNPMSLSADHVYFDVDGYDLRKDNLTYKISGGGQTASGPLNIIGGSDLFGHKGQTYWYYVTNQAIAFAAGISTITVHIALNGELIAPVTGPNSSSTKLPTYLRFGDATSATAIVQLLNH